MPNLRQWFLEKDIATGQRPGWKGFLHFFDILLRGFSQMYFVDHPIAGLLFLGGMIFASVQNQSKAYLIGFSIIGAILSTLTGLVLLHPSETEDNVLFDKTYTHGLCGYDGALVGWGVVLFLDTTDGLAATAVATVFLSCLAAVIRWWGARFFAPHVPIFSAGFNLATILYLLAASGNIIQRNSLPAPNTITNVTMTPAVFFQALFLGMSQFNFVDNIYASIFVLVGLLIASRKAFVGALMGSFIALVITWWVIQVTRQDLIAQGIYGYNAAGASMAIVVLSTSKWPAWRVWLYAMFTAMFVVLFQIAVQSVLNVMPIKLPVLTIPFLLGTWISIGGMNANHPAPLVVVAPAEGGASGTYAPIATSEAGDKTV